MSSLREQGDFLLCSSSKKGNKAQKKKSLDPWNTHRVCLISPALRDSEGRGGGAVSIEHLSARLENVSGLHGATWGGLWEASSPAAAPPCFITCEQKPPAPASWVICWKKTFSLTSAGSSPLVQLQFRLDDTDGCASTPFFKRNCDPWCTGLLKRSFNLP